MDIQKLVRKNILQMKPYSSARSEFDGDALVYLDANENPFGSPLPLNYNRYPDPLQKELKARLAEIKSVETQNISIGNGSDELIDQIIRIFCVPSADSIIVCPPTFKMYETAAALNDVRLKKVLLLEDFQIDADAILSDADGARIVFLCSPNNPTGNSIHRDLVEKIADNFQGIVVIDEAYADFANADSFIPWIEKYNNLIVLQTLSKSWGLAGLRIGIAYACEEITKLIARVKMPYNVSAVSQQLACDALKNLSLVAAWKAEITEQKAHLIASFKQYAFITTVFPTDANFILIRVTDAARLYQHLAAHGIIVRNQSSQPLLANCLRVTVGTPAENTLLIEALNNFKA